MVRGSSVEEDQSRFHGSKHRLSQSVGWVYSVVARGANMHSALMSGEAESSFDSEQRCVQG